MTVHKLYINCNLIPERTISTTTKSTTTTTTTKKSTTTTTTTTKSTTTTTTTTTKQTEFEIMIDGREMKSVFIWSGTQEVVATTINRGEKVRWIQKEDLPNGHKTGKIEFIKDKRQWNWMKAGGEFISLEDTGTLLRMTPHPSKV